MTWYSTWNVGLNGSKCTAVHFTPSASLSSISLSLYQVSKQPLATVTKYKDFGVTVHANLSWFKHIKFITSRLIVLFIGFVENSHLVQLPCTAIFTCFWLAPNCVTVLNYGGLGCTNTLYAWSIFGVGTLNSSFVMISWTTNPGSIPFVLCSVRNFFATMLLVKSIQNH